MPEKENLERLRQIWSRLLEGAVADSDEIDAAISALRRVEIRLLRPSAP